MWILVGSLSCKRYFYLFSCVLLQYAFFYIYILVNLCMGCREWLSQRSGLSCYVMEEILGGVCWILWSTLPSGFWICAGEGVVWKGSIDVLVSGVKI